jgi:hypothetical protein
VLVASVVCSTDCDARSLLATSHGWASRSHLPSVCKSWCLWFIGWFFLSGVGRLVVILAVAVASCATPLTIAVLRSQASEDWGIGCQTLSAVVILSSALSADAGSVVEVESGAKSLRSPFGSVATIEKGNV